MSRKKPKLSIFGLIIFSLFSLLVFSLAGFVYWWNLSLKPMDVKDETKQTVVIPPHAGATSIGQILYQQNLIRSPLAFKLYLKKQAWDTSLKSGKYQFAKNQDLASIAKSLKDGVLQDFWVTIPEGKRREEIAQILNKAFAQENLNFSVPDFLQASEDLEGYLFPDTYLLPRTITAEELVNLMRDNFDKKISDADKVKSSNLGLNFQQVLILASLVEREAKFEVDRPKIAGVLLNRLDMDMALQVDATVQYAIGSATCANKIGQDCNWWPVITDTKYNSDYNTYQYPDLPPGPICNPGLSVIQAVLNPDQNDYIYYLSEPSGKTHYAKTINEHEANIEKYLQ